MNLFLRLSTIAFIILIFSACSIKTNYPDSWSELKIPKENKILLNGKFECSGRLMYDGANINNGIVYLPSFIKMKDYKEGECDEVHIKQDDANSINVIIFKSNKAIEKKVLKLNKDYVYNDNYILMKKYEYSEAAEIIGYTSKNKYFKLTKNNDLIIERKSSMYGVLIFVVPVAISDNSFMLFKEKSNKYKERNTNPKAD